MRRRWFTIGRHRVTIETLPREPDALAYWLVDTAAFVLAPLLRLADRLHR